MFESIGHNAKYCSDFCKNVATKEIKKKYKQENKEKIKKKNAEYYLKRKYYILARNKKYDEMNPEKRKNRMVVYRQENKHKSRTNLANRRARKKNATLNIDLSSDLKIIYKESFDLEIETGLKYNVDHIIPLKNDNVCGLHVPWNLQIITFEDNMKKSNKFDNTYDNVSWKEN